MFQILDYHATSTQGVYSRADCTHMSAAATCNFASIADLLDEALRTRFICSVNNEAVLKAFLR